MSAINVLRQRKSVHLITDLAAYDRSGILVSIDHRKCIALSRMKAAMACTGPAMLGHYLASQLGLSFDSFDALVCNAESAVPSLFDEYAACERHGDASATMYIIGWHESRARPAAYAMEMCTGSSTRIAQIMANSGPDAGAVQFFKLSEQLLAGTPLPPPELCAAAGFVVPHDVNDMVPRRDLLHLLEVERQEEIEGAHWVGGGAWLTSIDRSGVSQRVLKRWHEDQVGRPIRPRPADWSSFVRGRRSSAVG